MRINNGKRTGTPIRRPLKEYEIEGVDYYVKPDPNFESLTYRVCHRKLRQVIQVGDVLFFRTLWRGKQYLIGYFVIEDKKGGEDDPILVANPERSCLVHFACPITLEIALQINPQTKFRFGVHENSSINGRLGRNYKKIDEVREKAIVEIVKSKKLLAKTA